MRKNEICDKTNIVKDISTIEISSINKVNVESDHRMLGYRVKYDFNGWKKTCLEKVRRNFKFPLKIENGAQALWNS